MLRILNAETYPDLLNEVTISFDSDQLISIDPADTREWRFSELRTVVDVDNDTADIQTFLNVPMAGGLPENSQLLRNDLILPEALETPPGMNCAVYQMSTLLKCDYAALEDVFRGLFPNCIMLK